MRDQDLIIPPPIPFADETIGELEEASEIFGTTTQELIDSVKDGANQERVNPANAYEDYFVPTGEIFVKIHTLEGAAYHAALASNIKELLASLTKLEDAVMDQDYKKITKKGNPGGTAYLKAIRKMRVWLADPVNNKPPYTIFAKGNKKLPFWAFSTLPGVTCPGAGACLENPEDPSKRGWCYSFSAWRNVTPYFRQLQNTILIRLKDHSWIEADAKSKFKKGQVVRLYVDGDFDSLETLTYWMHFCERFPENNFYGYSKSWMFFKQWHIKHGGMWPENYLLNLSSGTVFENPKEPLHPKAKKGLGSERFLEIVREMFALKNPKTGKPVVRGTFRALEVETKFPKKKEFERGKRRYSGVKGGLLKYRKGGSMEKWDSHRQEAMDAAKAANIKGDFGASGVFVCPGYCGECLVNGRHACGDRAFTNVAIVIGIH
jgi:hypothetical protein